MAVRDDFASGEVLQADDLNDTFASKLDLAGGKILQIVRATDGTLRTTTSGSYVDVTGMSVTITPQKADSAILIILQATVITADSTTSGVSAVFQITDSSNNAISGAQTVYHGIDSTGTDSELSAPVTAIAYATPATTSAVTYKVRARVIGTGATSFMNADSTGQLFALEISS